MPHKIYIDSRNRIAGTSSHFTFQLPGPVQMPASRVICDAVSIPNVFRTVNRHNDTVYLKEETGTGNNAVTLLRKVLLPRTFFTSNGLKGALMDALNAGTLVSGYVVDYSESTGFLTITHPSLVFFIYPHEGLKAGLWSGPDPYENNDAGVLCGWHGTALLQGSPVISNSHINLLPLHTLFLHSDLAGQNDTLGPQGEGTILRKIIIDMPQGSMVHDFHSQLFGDYVTLERGNIHTMTFWLTDFEGREIDTEFMNFLQFDICRLS